MTFNCKCLLSVFSFIGLTSLGLSLYLSFKNVDFLRHSVEVDGVVEEIIRRGDTFTPLVNYTDLNGTHRVLHSPHGGTLPSFFAGQKIKVVYDPRDPEFPLRAKIKTFQEVWGAVLFASIFGSIFLIIGFAGFLIFKIKK